MQVKTVHNQNGPVKTAHISSQNVLHFKSERPTFRVISSRGGSPLLIFRGRTSNPPPAWVEPRSLGDSPALYQFSKPATKVTEPAISLCSNDQTLTFDHYAEYSRCCLHSDDKIN